MSELFDWLAALDPTFAFLLILPFAVAAAGLCAETVRRNRERDSVQVKQAQRGYAPPRRDQRAWN